MRDNALTEGIDDVAGAGAAAIDVAESEFGDEAGVWPWAPWACAKKNNCIDRFVHAICYTVHMLQLDHFFTCKTV